MGGIHASENAPRRLSKPRTNTSSSNLLTAFSDQQADSSSSPLHSSDHDYFGENATVVNSQGERRSRRKSRIKIRAYLYGSNEEAIQNSSEEEDGRNGPSGTARNVRKRISRTGSSIMLLQSAKASSAYLSKSESQGSDPEESAIVAHQIKEKAYHDSLAAKNHVTSPIDEDKHPDSVMAPVRRKSLYTPGIATRNASDILRKPPQPENCISQLDRDYYYNPARPESSPLAQLAKLNLVEDGRNTPSSIHNFPQLGGLQLGTLRVTNGIPRNDTPDLVPRTPRPNSKSHEEYYTASEGSPTANLFGVSMKSGERSLDTKGEIQPSFQFADEDVITPQGSAFLTDATRDPAANIADEYMAELESSPFSHSETSTSKDNAKKEDLLDDEGVVIPRAEAPAAEMWRHLIDDAAAQQDYSHTTEDAFRQLNGYTPSTYGSQRLSVLSSMHSRYSVSTEVPKTDSGYSSNTSLYTTQRSGISYGHEAKFPEIESATPLSRSSGLSWPREIPDLFAKPRNCSSQPVSPAPIPYAVSVIPHNALQSSASNLFSSPSCQTVNAVQSSARIHLRPSSRAPVRKLQKSRPKSQPPPVNSITVQGHRELEQASIPRVPSVIAARHADRLQQFPLLDHTFSSSQHMTADEIDASTELRPMPFRFPSPANTFESATVDIHGVLTNALEARNSRKIPFLRLRKSTLVDGREITSSDIVRSTSWSDFGGGRKNKEQKRQAKEERAMERTLLREEREFAKRLEKDKKYLDRQTRKDREKCKIGRSYSASKTREPNHFDMLATIADFGTVAESLGRDPYDVATSMFSSASPSVRNKHPRHISGAMSRPKSMVGMDDIAAAELGRARSRARSQFNGRLSPSNEDYSSRRSSGKRPRPNSMFANNMPPVPAVAMVDLKAHSLGCNPSQRRSESFNDRGGIPGKSFRVSSFIVDAPPVPALPPIPQVHQEEGQIIRPRPRSIVLDEAQVPVSTSHELGNEDACNNGAAVSRPGVLSSSPGKIPTQLVPDLWSHGSIEKKGPRAAAKLRPQASSSNVHSSADEESPGDGNVWEAQRQAWAQRRKSAGEALLRNQTSEILENRTTRPNPSYMERQSIRLSFSSKKSPGKLQGSDQLKQTPRPGLSTIALHPNPLASNPQLSPQQRLYELESASTPYSSATEDSFHPPASEQVVRLERDPFLKQPPQSQSQIELPTPVPERAPPQPFPIHRKRVGSGPGIAMSTTAFDSLTGRYAGGLMYGYEPGCGLGGSAGTRSARTDASRKSVDVSKGFGIDLSDVPIFVAPAPLA